MKLHRHASPLPSATSWYASCARAQGVAPKLEFQKRISKAAHHILASSAETKVALPGSTWGQPGVNLGSTWGQPGVNLGSTWGHPGVNLGSTWGQPGVNLGSTWGQLGVNLQRPTRAAR